MKQRAIIAISIASFLLSGCGYTLVGRGSLPRHIKTIAIPIFENITLEQGVEDIVTQSIREVYVHGGKVNLVAEDEADALLTGTILIYKANEPLAYNDLNEISKYKLTVRVSVKLVDLKKNEIIWQDENLTEDDAYFGGPDVNPTEEQQNEEEALGRLAEGLAERVFALSTEGF